MKSKSAPRLIILAAAWLGGVTSALAQSPQAGYPTKVVKILAPYSSGAGPSIFMRIMGDKLAKAWGQQVIVDSRPGASGFIAIEAGKNAAPDGHELLIVSNAHVAINPALYKKLPYDTEKDFVPVGMIYRTPFFVTVKTDGPYPTVRALIAAAKASPGKLTYGAPYVGSPSHLGGADLEYRTGTKMVLVPYKDQSQIYASIANGDLDWMLSTLGSALPLLKAGRIKLIAVAAKHRSQSAPEVPTVEEVGGPAGFAVDAWIAVLAPRGTPRELVRRINADLNKQLGDSDVLERLKILGFEPSPGTPEQLAEEIRRDTKTYGDLVRRTGATAD
ncbi:MAG TPA: tripartite tricarboxylate transporter substrate binding protein [Burkholderiales bacterium]|nr:tripartite tricarboxylate transporter substrate binding protein [Burkholderiales bacterium]